MVLLDNRQSECCGMGTCGFASVSARRLLLSKLLRRNMTSGVERGSSAEWKIFNGSEDPALLAEVEVLRNEVISEVFPPTADSMQASNSLEREIDIKSMHIVRIAGEAVVAAARLTRINEYSFPFLEPELPEELSKHFIHASMLVIRKDHRGGKLFWNTAAKVGDLCLSMGLIGVVFQIAASDVELYTKLGGEKIADLYKHPELPLQAVGMKMFYAMDELGSDDAVFKFRRPAKCSTARLLSARAALQAAMNSLSLMRKRRSL